MDYGIEVNGLMKNYGSFVADAFLKITAEEMPPV